MTDLPSRREFKVLKALCFSTVEDRGQWPGVGDGTEAALVAKGWIEPATCETYDTVGFRATKAGHEAHEAGWKAGFALNHEERVDRALPITMMPVSRFLFFYIK